MKPQYAEYQNDKPKVQKSRPFIQPTKVRCRKEYNLVVYGPAIEGYSIMDYYDETGWEYSRLSGTHIIIGTRWW